MNTLNSSLIKLNPLYGIGCVNKFYTLKYSTLNKMHKEYKIKSKPRLFTYYKTVLSKDLVYKENINNLYLLPKMNKVVVSYFIDIEGNDGFTESFNDRKKSSTKLSASNINYVLPLESISTLKPKISIIKSFPKSNNKKKSRTGVISKIRIENTLRNKEIYSFLDKITVYILSLNKKVLNCKNKQMEKKLNNRKYQKYVENFSFANLFPFLDLNSFFLNNLYSQKNLNFYEENNKVINSYDKISTKETDISNKKILSSTTKGKKRLNTLWLQEKYLFKKINFSIFCLIKNNLLLNLLKGRSFDINSKKLSCKEVLFTGLQIV